MTSTEEEITHRFDLVWSNIIGSWRASCDCGEDFGYHIRVAPLAEDFDDHIDYDGEEVGEVDFEPTVTTRDSERHD